MEASGSRQPLVLAIVHNKGGVGKTTTTLILGRILARRWHVELRDYDETAHLTDLGRELAPEDHHTINRRLWLRNDATARTPQIVLIDAPPARGPRTHRALREADYVLIPAPPERMAMRAMRQMFDTIGEVRRSSQDGNPALQVLGVVPTLFDRRWPEHHGYMAQMRDTCAEQRIRLFPPVARRQSYLYLSTAGQDYQPVIEVLERTLARQPLLQEVAYA
jgi:cellulose biosynthesis protein BcsQ